MELLLGEPCAEGLNADISLLELSLVVIVLTLVIVHLFLAVEPHLVGIGSQLLDAHLHVRFVLLPSGNLVFVFDLELLHLSGLGFQVVRELLILL